MRLFCTLLAVLSAHIVFAQMPTITEQNTRQEELPVAYVPSTDTTRLSIFGVVVDELNEPVINAQVIVTRGNTQEGASITDFDGNYQVRPLAAGIYTVTISYPDYKQEVWEDVVIKGDSLTRLNVSIEPLPNAVRSPTSCSGTTVEIRRITRRVPLIDKQHPGSRTIVSTPDIH